MGTAQSKLDILIEAKNNAGGVINQVKSEAGGLTEAVTGIGAAFGIAFGVEALKGMAEAGVEMAREGAQAERLEGSFNALATKAGQSGDEMLKAMKAASQGTISDSALMLDANTAFSLGAARNTKDLTDLMDVASVRAKAMGLSTADAFNMLTEGIGRKAERQLKSLGIDVDAAAANDAYAQSLGTTSDKLSEQQQKTALLNAVLANSKVAIAANAGAARDAAGDFEAYDTAVKNAQDEVGKFLAPSVAAGANILTGYLDGQIKMLKNEEAALNAAWVASKNFVTGTHDLTSATLAAADAEGHADDITRRLTFGLSGLGTEAQNTGNKLMDMGIQGRAAMEQFNAAMNLSQGIASTIGGAASGAGSLFAGKLGGDAGLAKQKEVTGELNTQVKLWKDQGYTQQQINDVLLPGMVSQINAADSAMFSTATHTEQLSDAAKAAKEQFDNLKSVAENVLKSALNTGTGVDPQAVLEKMGIPRADVVNENARRLADIAQNGLKGQNWLGDFQSQVPDIWKMIRLAQNPQEEAAHLLQDFQDGLLTSPIDKAKAKEIIKRQIMGDANMSAMAQEIATEISQEMGIPLQEALAKTKGVLGGGGAGTTAGTDTATAFNDGANTQLDASDTGGGLVDKVISQINANMAKLGSAGKAAAKVWGDAFIGTVGDNVPPALISILVNLTTPGVMAQLAKNATLTGANP